MPRGAVSMLRGCAEIVLDKPSTLHVSHELADTEATSRVVTHSPLVRDLRITVGSKKWEHGM